MDFTWSDEQTELFDAIEKFARKELNDNLIENNRNCTFNRDGWKKCADFGIQSLSVPEEHGGLGLDPLTTVGALDRLGYACRDNGLVFSLNAHMWTVVMPLISFGTEEQKEKFLPGLLDGSLIGANATSEPSAGSDAYSLRTTATLDGDKYILNGNKTWVTNGPVADLSVVYATVDKSKGPQGVTAFFVEKDAPGLRVGEELEKMGIRTSPMSELFFDDCEIPVANRLGKEGAGTNLFTHAMIWERGCILANAVGSMQHIMETCIAYAKQRKQFGQSIGKFQAVADKIVAMKLRLESARLLLYKGAWERSQGKSAFLEAAMTKLYLSDCWVRTCEAAIQIHGASGYMVEYEIERELRDAIASRLYSGTDEIQRSIIASMLGL